MSLIEIPLFDGGLVTFADPEDIDKTAAVVSTNFDIDEPGKLVKRQGFICLHLLDQIVCHYF